MNALDEVCGEHGDNCTSTVRKESQFFALLDLLSRLPSPIDGSDEHGAHSDDRYFLTSLGVPYENDRALIRGEHVEIDFVDGLGVDGVVRSIERRQSRGKPTNLALTRLCW